MGQQFTPSTGASVERVPEVRVLLHEDSNLVIMLPHIAVGFDYPTILRGTTPHFNVYCDPGLGMAGQDIADGVLASCENEYKSLQLLFGGISTGPYNIIIAALDPSGRGRGGAYHYGCDATDIYCDARIIPGVDIEHTRFVLVAEETEVFSDTQGLGWDCGASNGEALSRILAAVLYPNALKGFVTASAWLNAPGRPDFVTVNDPTDRNPVSIGCVVLFLNYIRHQLNFSWEQIVQAGGATPAKTYYKLTGKHNAFAPFKALMQKVYPEGMHVRLPTDNIFPIADSGL